MNLTPVDGLWTLTTTPLADPNPEPYEQVVVELAGAVAVWPLDAAPGRWPTLTLTDVDEADWLWRWIGPQAHIAVHTAITEGRPGAIEAAIDADEIARVQRLGLGHWLRQWWPTSPTTDIPALDPVLLALELAVLTVHCDAILGDRWDSEPDLLATVSATEVAQVVAAVPAAGALVAELPDEWVPHWTQTELDAVRAGTLAVARRDDYALAAGGTASGSSTAVAHGRSSIDWAAVPPGIFDAAEGSLRWSVDIAQTVRVDLAAQLLTGADPTGLAVWVWSPPLDPQDRSGVGATATLDGAGRATLELPIEPALAWTLPWHQLVAGIGPRRGDHSTARERIRDFVRSRLAGEATFLAEEQAAVDDW